MDFSSDGPIAPRHPHFRALHGERIEDDFHWMRDHDDPEMLAYLQAERAFYEEHTAALAPLRQEIAGSLRAGVPDRTQGCPWRSGGWLYQWQHAAGAQYPALVRFETDGPGHDVSGTPQVVLDLEAFAAGAAYLETGVVEVNDDHTLLAYSVDLAGSEVYQLRFRDLTTGRDLDDVVEGTYYGGAWTADGSAFYYTVVDAAYRPHQVWRHRLGTPAADDQLVHAEQDRRFELTLRRTRSGDFIVVTAVSRSTRQEFVVPAGGQDQVVRPLRERVAGVEDTAEHQRDEAGSGPGRWLVVTNESAREFRLVGADVSAWQEGRADWRELLPERAGVRLERAEAFAAAVVLLSRSDARPRCEVAPGAAAGPDAVVPGWVVDGGQAGSTALFGRTDDYDSPGFVVELTGLCEPDRFVLVPFDGGPAPVAASAGASAAGADLPSADPVPGATIHTRAAPGLDPSRYRRERVLVPARDGQLVPVDIAYAVTTPLDGTAPCLVWGYGSYESCDWAVFDPALPEWLDRGFVYALSHPRGGGERGRAWWDDGHLASKANTFRDHIDVADWLVAQRYCDGTRVVTRGLSAGGLLQGAVLTMRPDRWAGVIAEVPFVDCVTSMLDESVPLTVTEWEEWGNPSVPQEYAWIRDYTPYENLPPVGPGAPRWPALLVTGALHDPRVLVHEPAKWVAALRRIAADQSRVLFRAETGPGAHTGPAGRFAAMDYEAEVLTWALSVTS